MDFNEIAKVTKNFSGAELAGLVREASSYALRRGVQTDASGELNVIEEDVLITYVSI